MERTLCALGMPMTVPQPLQYQGFQKAIGKHHQIAHVSSHPEHNLQAELQVPHVSSYCTTRCNVFIRQTGVKSLQNPMGWFLLVGAICSTLMGRQRWGTSLGPRDVPQKAAVGVIKHGTPWNVPHSSFPQRTAINQE
jgi:hypothetical protein